MIAEREIRAFYTKDLVRVYQAYNSTIADSAIKHQKFVSPPFKLERTTWIKPSFLWMMYRSGWATKENQEHILAIDITHEGFQWALSNSYLSHFDKNVYRSDEDWKKAKSIAPVVIQWDPERDIFLNKLNYRAIQIGLLPESIKNYISQWIIRISDITPIAQKIKSLINTQKMAEVELLLPHEKHYAIATNIKQQIGIIT
jgi:hypothetical protein